MIGLNVNIVENLKRVEDSAAEAQFRNLGHAAASIRKTSIESIDVSPDPSDPGEPPHTRRKQLPRAITYDVDSDSAVIGPRASVVGEAGRAHELGEEFHGQEFDERPYMEPALEANLSRFADEWTGSIGE